MAHALIPAHLHCRGCAPRNPRVSGYVEDASMVTTELRACEWFVWDLRRSNLIDRGRLDQVVGAFLQKHPRAEPPELADSLIAQTILTPFQAERLRQAETQGFVLGP